MGGARVVYVLSLMARPLTVGDGCDSASASRCARCLGWFGASNDRGDGVEGRESEE